MGRGMSVYWDENGVSGQVEYPAWLRRLIGKLLCWRKRHKWHGWQCSRIGCTATNTSFEVARKRMIVGKGSFITSESSDAKGGE